MDLEKIKDKALIIDTMYLIDWKHTLIHGKQLSNFEWFMDNRGQNIKHSIKEIENIEVEDKLFEFVLEKIERLKYTGIRHLVFSTYPVLTTEKYEKINMSEKANQYKNLLKKKELERITSLQKRRGFVNKLLEKLSF